MRSPRAVAGAPRKRLVVSSDAKSALWEPARQALAAPPAAVVITGDGRKPPTLEECLSAPGSVTVLFEVGAGELGIFERDPQVRACLDAGATVVAVFADPREAAECRRRIAAARG